MGNGIAQRQVETDNIIKLAAQRCLYSKAKRIMAIQLTLSVPIIILISIINLYLSNSTFMGFLGKKSIDFTWLVATSGILITIFDIFHLSPLVDKNKELAAKIQESFDCDVLDIPWNEITIGRKPDLEDIIENANKYSETRKDPGFRSLINWYPKNIDNLPLDIARIVCQRSNMRWDIDLRKRILYIFTFIAVIMFFLLLFIGILKELSIRTFMVTLSLFLPILIFSFRLIQQNKNAISNLKDMKKHAETAWNQVIFSSLLSKNLDDVDRKLQDNLFLNRKNNPLIFDFIYKIYRQEHESSISYSCDKMIENYKKAVAS